MAETYDVAVVGLGGLGSATAWHLARRGVSVVGLERFALGHDRGASHDTSRILRHSYHTPGYVGLTVEAYEDWDDLSDHAAEPMTTITGGVDLFPPDGAIPRLDYETSMSAHAVPYEVLDTVAMAARWPQFRLPEGTTALFQERTGIVHAARTVAACQRLATSARAALMAGVAVTSIRPSGDAVLVSTADGTSYSCGAVVVTADAWAAELVEPLGVRLPLTVTEEQVTYFDPVAPGAFTPDRFPVWIWMDDPSFYGFPSFGEPTVKAAQDCGGPAVTGEERSGTTDLEMLKVLADFMGSTLPDSGRPGRSKRCLYTLTPDRDFVLDRVPDQSVVVGLGAAHGFKFVPTFGRRLAHLALGAPVDEELAPYRLDRPGLTDPSFAPSWMV